MSSHVLTGIEKVDNEDATLLEGKTCIFYLSFTGMCVCVFLDAGEGFMMGL